MDVWRKKFNHIKLLESSEESFLHLFSAKEDQISSDEHVFLIQNFQISFQISGGNKILL